MQGGLRLRDLTWQELAAIARRGKSAESKDADDAQARKLLDDLKTGKFQLPKELQGLTNGQAG